MPTFNIKIYKYRYKAKGNKKNVYTLVQTVKEMEKPEAFYANEYTNP